MNDPSPEIKPATHWGCNLALLIREFPAQVEMNLETGTLLGKASNNAGLNPLLREARILTIDCKPSTVKCSPRAKHVFGETPVGVSHKNFASS